MYTFQGYRPTTSGEPKWWDSKVSPMRGAEGHIEQLLCISRDITEHQRVENERKRAEEDRQQTEAALQASEEQFRRFLVVGSDLQVITGNDGYFHWVSPTFERLLGWTSAEMISRPWLELVHPDDIPTSELETASLFSGNEIFAFENRYQHKDGSYRWLLWNAKPYPAEQIIYGTAVDITKRKQAEMALRESEERFRTLTATIPQLIWTTTPDGTVDYLSQQWADYIGLPPEQLYDWHWQNVVHPEDLSNTLRDWRYSLQTGESLEIKHRFRFHTSEWRWQLVRGTPIKDEAGQITKWVGTCTDIQNEIDAQTALHQSEARLRTVAANLPNGVAFIVDRELRYQLAEGKALEATSFTSQDLVGKTIWEALDPSLAAIYELHYRQALCGEPFSWEHNSHDRHYISHGVPLYDDRSEVEAVLVVSYDITDRKQTEVALRQSETRYRTLFESIDQGFCVIEVLFDENSKPIDYRFLEINPAFEQQTGLIDAQGKRMRELAPDHEEHWFEIYGNIALTGESNRFENRAAALHRWYDVYAFRIGQPNEGKVAILGSALNHCGIGGNIVPAPRSRG
ncbi:MAG: PAS domain S-box protein [Trichocoleus desertorum ATA4-8-CV12]|nr:PAS domain S-box protein [Trichocoleus desertorum ATA4-8-CV12]